MNGEAEKAQKLTLDEAMNLISDIARNGDGADKFRALKIVMAQQQSSVTLPEPLSTDEVVDRLARLMRGVGPVSTQWAYREAFPMSKKEIFEHEAKLNPDDVSPFQKARLPKTLKQLYKQFPEIKRPGFPPGYPMRGGLERQQQWCQVKALEILRRREEERLSHLAKEATITPEQAVDAGD